MSSDAAEQRVLEAVESRRELVNEALDGDVPMKSPDRLYEATRYLLEAGGKRLRPTVSLLTAEALADVEPLSVDYHAFPALDGAEIDVMSAATSIEVIQSFTLIHDDIMDDDDLRRGVPAVHTEYDTETAILAGDTLYAKAFELLSETGADPTNGIEAVRRLATTCIRICEGQALDIEFERRSEVLPEEYLEMVELAVYRYGIDSGRAFQIQDDVLDLTVPSETLGKQRGSDLVENKETLITLHARQQGVDVDGLVDATDVDAVSEAEIDDAVAALEDAGSIDYAESKARELAANAKDHLGVLPDNEARSLLGEISEYLITRGY
jgi:geranylgeranyl diphosphate synthase type I